jgi:Uma2 family endonuclease
MRRHESLSADYRWKDFIALPEDDRRELIDGRLEELDMPKKWHERMVATVLAALAGYCGRRGLVLLGSGFRIRITPLRSVMPDVQVLTEKTYQEASDDGLESGHPELVVEVISPTSRAHDRVRKVDWYARIGVPEYWLIDVDARSIERLVLDGGSYRIAQHASGDEVFQPKSMRGVKLKLSDLWKAMS